MPPNCSYLYDMSTKKSYSISLQETRESTTYIAVLYGEYLAIPEGSVRFLSLCRNTSHTVWSLFTTVLLISMQRILHEYPASSKALQVADLPSTSSIRSLSLSRSLLHLFIYALDISNFDVHGAVLTALLVIVILSRVRRERQQRTETVFQVSNVCSGATCARMACLRDNSSYLCWWTTKQILTRRCQRLEIFLPKFQVQIGSEITGLFIF